MKKIYMHEKDIPTGCAQCLCYGYNGYCIAGNFIIALLVDGKSEHCPLKSLESHDKELKKKVLHDLVTAIKE